MFDPNCMFKNTFMLKLLFIVTLFFAGSSFSQETTREKCGEVLTETCKRKPIFQNSKEDISRYFEEQISFRSEEQFRGIYQVKMNCRGEIYEADLVKGNLSESTLSEIQAALLKMPQWKPANYDGEVDYTFYIDFMFKGQGLRVNTIMH